jgi:hypothetical protein
MFVSLERDDINGLSEDVGIKMLLRTTQTLVKGELASQPPAQPVEPIALVRDPRANVSACQPADDRQEPAAAVRDNVDPYLVSQSVNTDAGRITIYALYGQHEGGVATERSRLPSTIKGSCAPRGLFAINIPDLGVNLISNTGEHRGLKVLFWHSFLMIGHHHHFLAMGTDQWGVDTSYFMTTMYHGLSLEVYNRTPSQASCNQMFNYQEADVFQSPRALLRFLTGKFHAGENGIQIESFEISKGAARASCDSPDLMGRNKGIIDCLESLKAFIRTFINEGFSDVFAPVQNLFKVSEFLHRSSSKVLLKYLNVCYGVVFNALCTATSVRTIAHAQPVSIKGIGNLNQALLEVSEAIVRVLSSKSRVKSMEEDFTGRQAEEALRLKVINKFDNMGDLTKASPLKKRPAEGRAEELVDIKKKKKAKRKDKKASNAASSPPAVSGIKIKLEPGSGAKGDVTSPPVKRDGPCIYHLAVKLNLKDPSNIAYKCPHGVAACRYRHIALGSTTRDKAERAAKNCTDLTLKALLLSGIASSSELL